MWWRSLYQLWREDWPCYAALLAYALAAQIVIASTLGAPKFTSVLLSNLSALSVLLLVWWLLVAVARAIRRRPEAPLRQLPESVRSLAEPRLLSALAMLLVLPVFLDSFMVYKGLLPVLFDGYRWDERLADWDAALHGGHDVWPLLYPWLAHPAATFTLQMIYQPLWFIGAILTPVLLAASAVPTALRRRYFYTYMLSWLLLGSLLAGVFLSGGPVFYGYYTGDEARFAALGPFLRSHDLPLVSAAELQELLLTAARSGVDSGVGGISAFPSMHLSMTMLTVLLLGTLWRWSWWLSLPVLIAMQLGSVWLGWHYAIDGYFSIIATALIWFAVGGMQRWWHNRHHA